MKGSNLHWRINQQIQAHEVRALDAEGKQLGIMSVSEALKIAEEKGLDVIEIAPSATPPVVKIIELGKFRYLEEKKAKKEAKGSKASELKEIRLSPFIAENDYNTRFARIKEFLEDKHKVKVVVVFKGREMRSKQFGYALLDKLNLELKGKIAIDMQPKFLGRYLTEIISPLNKPNAETKD